ncbi:MAG TPA: S8 family serine peptidase, partial [Bacteroidota bacterium]
MPARNTTGFFTITLILLVSFARPVEAGGNDRLLRNVDPRLRPLMQSALTKSESSSNPFTTVKPVGIDRTGNELYGVIVYTEDPGGLIHAGVEVESRFPSFVTVRAPLNLIRTIADLPGVQWIEAGGELRPSLDVSVPKTGADKVQSGLVDGTPYKGTGVIVGVIDTGIDWKHLDFRSDTDTTRSRILFLWDQTLTKTGSEKTPRDRDLTLPNYGVEYLQTEVNDEIDGFPASFVREQDTNDHGTHVAGIAAGDGSSSASGFVGMAPEADLIIIKAGNSSFPSANIIDGIAYVNKKAADLGKPYVLNLSLGGHTGAHDGTDGEEVALDNVLGAPGKVAVVAAGNEGSTPIHAGGTVAEGGSTFVEFTIPAYTPMSGNQNDFVVFDMWYDGTDAMSVTVRTPSGAT